MYPQILLLPALAVLHATLAIPWGGGGRGGANNAPPAAPPATTVTPATTAAAPTATLVAASSVAAPSTVAGVATTGAPVVVGQGIDGIQIGSNDGVISHEITITNNCGKGEAYFQHGSGIPAQPIANGQSVIINDPVNMGMAWMYGGGYPCGIANGQDCAMVEFTLFDPLDHGGTAANQAQNAADYSLLTDGNGSHKYYYPIMYELTGCDANPKLLQCTSSDCAGSFNGPGLGPTTTGTVTQCVGSNVGIHITFC